MNVIILSLTVGLLLFMFSQGLRLRFADLSSFSPATLGRAFLAVDVIVPLVAVAVVGWLRPPTPVMGCLALMAASPMAAFGLGHVAKTAEMRRKWTGIYFILLAGSLVTTPLALSLLAGVFHFEAHVAPLAIAQKVFLTVVLPVMVGMLVQRYRPPTAERIVGTVEKVGAVLVIIPFLVIVIANLREFATFGARGYLAVAVFVALSLTFGHILGGHDPEDRTLLASESATRNPALAILIAQASFPHARIAAVLIPYYITFLVLKSAYRFWASHRPQGGGLFTHRSRAAR